MWKLFLKIPFLIAKFFLDWSLLEKKCWIETKKQFLVAEQNFFFWQNLIRSLKDRQNLVIFYLLYHFKLVFLKSCESLSIFINLFFSLNRLEDFAKLYDIIKNERNKCVNLIQTSTQRAAEMQEKIKILQNEIEILRTAAAAKDRWCYPFLYMLQYILGKADTINVKIIVHFFDLIINPLSGRIFTVFG